LIEERNASDYVIARYIYEGGVDRPVKAIIGGDEYYFQQDGLGNVSALLDRSGTIVEQYSYDIFGCPTIIGQGVKAAPLTPFLFTGREYDSETGLYHYRQRGYSPIVGRFLNCDPIGFEGGLNLYSYVRNNSVNWIDPMGLRIVFPEGYDTKGLCDKLMQTELGQKLLDYFSGDDHNVYVNLNDRGINAYRIFGPVINWDPNSFLDFGRSGSNSPESQFLHELDHAYHDAVNPRQYSADKRNKGDKEFTRKWTNMEEYKTITEVNAANRVWGETIRNSHAGGAQKHRQ